MNMRKVKLIKEVFLERARREEFNSGVTKAIVEELDGKILKTDIDKSFMPKKTNVKIYNINGWVIFEDELEFLEEESL